MADFENRAEWEWRLTAALADVGDDYAAQIVAALGQPPSLGNLGSGFWEQFGNSLRAALQPAFEAVYIEMARQIMSNSPIGVAWEGIVQSAATWAEQYAFGLVRGLVDTTRTALQQAVSAYFRGPQTVQELTRRIAQALMPQTRAELIAQTEITRAADRGQQAFVDELRRTNPALVMDEYWETNNDEFVCPICGPRHNQRRGTNWDEPPPAHPRCRCKRRYVLRLPRQRQALQV